jgi:hypothetical protein
VTVVSESNYARLSASRALDTDRCSYVLSVDDQFAAARLYRTAGSGAVSAAAVRRPDGHVGLVQESSGCLVSPRSRADPIVRLVMSRKLVAAACQRECGASRRRRLAHSRSWELLLFQ